MLKPMHHDILVVQITVWVGGTTTDDEGNQVRDPDATPVVLEGWDIQPIPTTVPMSFTPGGATQVPNARRAFGPTSDAQHMRIGGKMKNNRTGEMYRISNFQDWGSHLEMYLEVSI